MSISRRGLGALDKQLEGLNLVLGQFVVAVRDEIFGTNGSNLVPTGDLGNSNATPVNAIVRRTQASPGTVTPALIHHSDAASEGKLKAEADAEPAV